MTDAKVEPGASAVQRNEDPLLRVRGLTKHFVPSRLGFGSTGAAVRAVQGVDLDLWRGETVALVGESGCGKTTAARTALRLEEATAGEIHFDGSDVRAMSRRQLRDFRRRAQMVFQDVTGALNPRLSAGATLGEVLEVHGLEQGDARARVLSLLERVGLGREHLSAYPHELSGGQRQRLGIARALAVEPDLLVLDEPVSALDVSVRAQIVNLLLDLQRDLGLTYLFIAHDLPLVEHVADRVAVMYLGRVVETAPAPEIFAAPAHPYTRALLSAVPGWAPGAGPRRRRAVLAGEPPSPLTPPPGCPFHPRCPHPARDAECITAIPTSRALGPGRFVACVKASSDP